MFSLRAKLLVDYYLGGLLQAILKPFVMLLGRVLRRNHKISEARDVTIMKILGGGSLVLAYPSLLAIKRSGRKLRLLTSDKVKAFGDILTLFDEVIVIRESTPLKMIKDAIAAWWKLLGTDTIVDLEIHSRLSTVFCLFTCARNRVAFYGANSFWRQGISTHLLFCNGSTGIYYSYQQVANLFGVEALTFREASNSFQQGLDGRNANIGPRNEGGYALAIAPACSDLGKERMLEIDEWAKVVREKTSVEDGPVTLSLLGGKGDHGYLEKLRHRFLQDNPVLTIVNYAGKLSLEASVNHLRTVNELLAIDSAMLHFARLVGTHTTSYWGPTDPATRLQKTDLALDVIHYHRLPCSPCVHVASIAPCKGNNLCIRFAVNPNCGAPSNPAWLA